MCVWKTSSREKPVHPPTFHNCFMVGFPVYSLFFVYFCFQMKENLKPAICVCFLLGRLFFFLSFFFWERRFLFSLFVKFCLLHYFLMKSSLVFNWECMYRCYFLMKSVLVLDVSCTKMFRNELVLALLHWEYSWQIHIDHDNNVIIIIDYLWSPIL